MMGWLEMEKYAFLSLLLPVGAVSLLFRSVNRARTIIMKALTLV
jgi:acetyl-CoA carboxylase alpha subunit